jgi:hypothetical protein
MSNYNDLYCYVQKILQQVNTIVKQKLKILWEGVTVTSAAKSINFTGDVTVSSTNDDVTVNIDCDCEGGGGSGSFTTLRYGLVEYNTTLTEQIINNGFSTLVIENTPQYFVFPPRLEEQPPNANDAYIRDEGILGFWIAEPATEPLKEFFTFEAFNFYNHSRPIPNAITNYSVEVLTVGTWRVYYWKDLVASTLYYTTSHKRLGFFLYTDETVNIENYPFEIQIAAGGVNDLLQDSPNNYLKLTGQFKESPITFNSSNLVGGYLFLTQKIQNFTVEYFFENLDFGSFGSNLSIQSPVDSTEIYNQPFVQDSVQTITLNNINCYPPDSYLEFSQST